MDIKGAAVDGLKRAASIFLQDLQALPEDAYTRQFGPKVRTVADIVYEVNLVNDDIGRNLRGEQTSEWPDEGWIKAPEDFRSKDVVMRAFEESSSRLVATADSFGADEFEVKVQTERGESTRFDRCRFATLHLWYHSGQLNFIQTLLEDDGWHWS